MVTFQTETPIQDHPVWENNPPTPKNALAGETIIYSVGPDGVDDRALKHCGVGGPQSELGDWLFRLEIPQSVIPVTPGTAAAPIQ